MKCPDATIGRISVSAYRISTDYPESDGTPEWKATTASRTGIGDTYADRSTALLVKDLLASLIDGRDAMSVTHHWAVMIHAARNLRRPGIVSCCAARAAIHLEYFHGRERIELMLFEGAVEPHEGMAISARPRNGIQEIRCAQV
jgi:hypothetical protein